MLSISHTKNSLRIWKSHNYKVRMKLDENKLAYVRGDIMNKKRLTDLQLKHIKEKVTADVKDIDSGNEGIRNGDVGDVDEVTGSVNCTDAETRETRTRNVDQRENTNHIGSLDNIPIGRA